MPRNNSDLAAEVRRLGLIGQKEAEPVIIIHISGGMVADVGYTGNTPIEVIFVDDDVLAVEDEGRDVWIESTTKIEDWSQDDGDPLLRAAREMSPDLRHKLGLPPQCFDGDKVW